MEKSFDQEAIPQRFSTAKRIGISLLILLSLSLNGCAIGNLSMSIQVMLYSGDGVIHNCASSPPILGMLFLFPGYRIDFPKFRSDRPYQTSYRISNLPQRGGHPAIIYLRFRPERNPGTALKPKESVTAIFRVVLESAEGRVLHSAELPVAGSSWTTWGGPSEGDEFGVYQLQKSELQFKPRTGYVLKVSYAPADVPPPAHELYFSIENRGSK